MATPQPPRPISSSPSKSDDSPTQSLQRVDDVEVGGNEEMHSSSGENLSPCSDEDLTALDWKKITEAVKTVEEHETMVKEKEKNLDELREQLAHCREHLSHLLDAQHSLEQQRHSTTDTATAGLLQAKLKRLLQDLTVEQASEETIAASVRESELELAKAELALARVREGAPHLERGRSLLARTKRQQAANRLSTRNKMAMNAHRLKATKERAYRSMLRDKNVQAKAAIRKARQAQQDGLDFLNQSALRRREEAAAREEGQRTHLQRRVRALLDFKESLEASRGAIAARQLLRSEQERRRKKGEEEERDGIVARGGNPSEVALRKKRATEFKETKEAFESRKQERQLEIVAKLLEEEKLSKRRRGHTSKAVPHSQQLSLIGKWQAHKKRKEEWSRNKSEDQPKDEGGTFEKDRHKDGRGTFVEEDTPGEGEVPSRQAGLDGDTEMTSSESEDGDLGVVQDTGASKEDSLAEPEIRGLWDANKAWCKKAGPKDSSAEAHPSIQTKAEQEMMSRTMESLRQNIVTKQVAGGKEFKGQAFLSKPDEVVFEDFEVGVLYRKRLQLTNVSYTINHCKLVGVSQELRDFVSVEFSPPGVMSAGLTCPMVVTFEPKISADLLGSILMMAHTGPFTIPVRCLTKKCIITVESAQVDFGKVCVGETIQHLVTIHNSGAMPTHFQLMPLAQPPAAAQANSASSKDGSIKSSGGPLADRSTASIMSTVELHPTPPSTLLHMTALTCRSAVELAPHSHSLELELAKHGSGMELVVPGGGPDHAEQHEDQVVAMATGAMASEGGAPNSLDVCIKTGKLTEGDIEGFGSINIELVFNPTAIGRYTAEFSLTFSHPSVQPVTITAQGEGSDLPIFVEQEVMDFHICMLDRPYQDCLAITNRATIAHTVVVNIPEELHTHLQVLPKQAVIAGGSSTYIQLKFRPTHDIFTHCAKYLNTATSILEVVVKVIVEGQTKPVLFTFKAQLTVSDIEFSVPLLDFGSCTLQESVVAPILLINKSALPQSYGFIHLPEEISVQPNDGFGTLLPLESQNLDVIFSPRKPREYKFQLTCLTDINRRFELPCMGKGIMTALELSENCLEFAATTLYSTSMARVSLSNHRLSRLSSAAIRGEGPPQGPKMFEFCPPEQCPVTMCPLTGTVQPGKSVSIEVKVHMCLDPQEVMEEAHRLSQQAANLEQKRPDPPVVTVEDPSPKKAKQQGKMSRVPSGRSSTQPPPPPLPTGAKPESRQPEKPTEGSDMWWQAFSNLLCNFQDRCLNFSIPCFCSHVGGPSPSVQPSYRLEDTLYLEVSVPILRPSLVVTSHNGRTAVTFGNVSRGNVVSRRVTIRNISDKFLHIVPSLLDPCGPFEIRNAVRDLAAGGSQTVIIQFSPKHDKQYLESLKFTYGSSHLEVQLSGKGVTSNLEVSQEGQLNMGDVISGDSNARTIKLTNTSELELDYLLRMDGVGGCGGVKGQAGSDIIGSRNLNGQQVFTCVPFQGRILPGSTQEVVVSFSPDHQSSWYKDTLHIDVNGKEASTLGLKGRAWASNMYLCHDDGCCPTLESLEALPTQTTPPTITLQFGSCHDGESVSKTLLAGCIKSAMSKKNSGEVSIEAPSNGIKCFTIEPLKTTVEAGTTKNITITFTPTKTSSADIIVSTTTVTLKSESTQQYKLVLLGMIL